MAKPSPRAGTEIHSVSRIQSFAEKGETSFDMQLALAEDGDIKNQFLVGMVFLNGNGRPKNVDEAIRFFKMAADRNHPQALSNLGAMADGGIGMPKNEVLAQEYWMKASQQGIPQAQFNLALYYEAGKGGLEMSSIQSVKYYEMAAARGYAKAFANLGVIYEQGRYNEIKSNIELSIKCYQEAINRGNIAAAAFNLGCIYDEGRIGIPINKSEANKYFKLAKEFKLDENVFKLRWKRWFQQNWIIIAAITALTIQHGIIYMTLGLFWTIAALIIPLTIGIVLAFLTTRRK